MGIFSPSPAKKLCLEAEAKLAQNEPHEALRSLLRAFPEDAKYKPLYELAAAAMRQQGADDMVTLFERVVQNKRDTEAIRDIGKLFVDQGYASAGAAVLDWANEQKPKDKMIALYLAEALCQTFQPKEARTTLRFADLGNDFWGHYELYYTALLSGEEFGTGEFLEGARANLSQEGELPEQVRFVLDKLDRMRARLLAHPKPDTHIRDWQFIQYGSVTLDFFEDVSVAGGRFPGMHWAQNDSIYLISRRLRRLFDGVGHRPQFILSFPDKDSQILSHIFASVLGIPIRGEFRDHMENEERDHSLIVAGDAETLNAYEDLSWPAEGEWLYAHTLNWRQHHRYCPDILGLLSQFYEFPWGKKMRVDSETKETVHEEPDGRPAEEIAKEILATPPEGSALSDEAFREDLEFYLRMKEYLIQGEEGNPRRPRFGLDSPVPGVFF